MFSNMGAPNQINPSVFSLNELIPCPAPGCGCEGFVKFHSGLLFFDCILCGIKPLPFQASPPIKCPYSDCPGSGPQLQTSTGNYYECICCEARLWLCPTRPTSYGVSMLPSPYTISSGSEHQSPLSPRVASVSPPTLMGTTTTHIQASNAVQLPLARRVRRSPICPICTKMFNSSSHLTTHLHRHTGERPYPCPHCNKSFIQAYERKEHLRTHTGEKPYVCPECHHSFAYSTNFARHMKLHARKH